MGVVEKLKRLHKQTLLKLNDIKRVLIADKAGVNNEEYLGRARTLDSYVNGDKNPEEEVPAADQSEQKVAQNTIAEPKKVARASTRKKTIVTDYGKF